MSNENTCRDTQSLSFIWDAWPSIEPFRDKVGARFYYSMRWHEAKGWQSTSAYMRSKW